MKHSTIVLALLFLLAGSTRAQVGFGLTGGVNFATAGGADVFSGTKNFTGFAAGAYLDVDVPFLLSFQPEVLYSVKGYIVENTYTILGNSYTSKGTATLGYLEIPVLVKYTLPVPILKPSLFVGPSLGILLSGRGKVEVTGQPTQEMDIKSSYRSADWGAVFGASASVLVVRVSARYTVGLTTLSSDGQLKTYNRVWSIMIELPV